MRARAAAESERRCWIENCEPRRGCHQILVLLRTALDLPSIRASHAVKLLPDHTASYWAMVRTAQANAHAITQLDHSRVAKGGHLEPVYHRIYRH